MRIGGKRVRAWLAVGLLVVIGLAAYRIGLNLWGNYHRRAVDAALARRDFVAAQSELANCLWLWPGRDELHLLLARTARRQHNLSEARWRLRQCQGAGSSEAVALEQCLLQIQQGDFGSSGELDRYCDAFPESPEAMLIEEAQIEGSLAALDVPRARAYLKNWSRRRKSSADELQGHLWKATACLLAKEVEQAAGCFREAVQLDPANREARLGLAQLLIHSDPTEAEKHLRVLRQMNSSDAEVLYHVALVERNLGQLQVAAGMLDELLAMAPEHVEGMVLRGRVALDMRQVEEAGRWFRRAEEIEPKHREVMLALIEYLRLDGQAAEVDRYERLAQEIKAEVVKHVETVLNKRRRPPAAADERPTPGPAPH